MGKTLHDLLISTQWGSIENLFLEFYPEEDIVFFKQLYWRLFNIAPKKNDFGGELYVEAFDKSEFQTLSDDELYYEVEYYNEITDEMWSIYLGFSVSEKSLSTLSFEEIICHLLFELTYGELENLIQ